MASVASRPHVVEIEPQVRSLGNRNLVVRMEVALTAVKAVAKLREHSIGRRGAKAGFSEHFDNGRLPRAVDAPPTIALEAKDPQPKVISIVPALGSCTASYVVFTLSLAAVRLARTAGSQFGTARG